MKHYSQIFELGPRGIGRTYQLAQACRELGATLLCHNQEYARDVAEQFNVKTRPIDIAILDTQRGPFLADHNAMLHVCLRYEDEIRRFQKVLKSVRVQIDEQRDEVENLRKQALRDAQFVPMSDDYIKRRILEDLTDRACKIGAIKSGIPKSLSEFVDWLRKLYPELYSPAEQSAEQYGVAQEFESEGDMYESITGHRSKVLDADVDESIETLNKLARVRMDAIRKRALKQMDAIRKGMDAAQPDMIIIDEASDFTQGHVDHVMDLPGIDDPKGLLPPDMPVIDETIIIEPKPRKHAPDCALLKAFEAGALQGRCDCPLSKKVRQFYECGICGHFHLTSWKGDCHEDLNHFLFTEDQLSTYELDNALTWEAFIGESP